MALAYYASATRWSTELLFFEITRNDLYEEYYKSLSLFWHSLDNWLFVFKNIQQTKRFEFILTYKFELIIEINFAGQGGMNMGCLQNTNARWADWKTGKHSNNVILRWYQNKYFKLACSSDWTRSRSSEINLQTCAAGRLRNSSCLTTSLWKLKYDWHHINYVY